MKSWGLLTELRMLAYVRFQGWRTRHQPVTFADVLQAFDDDRLRRPQSRFHQEYRAIAQLHVRGVLGVRRYDA